MSKQSQSKGELLVLRPKASRVMRWALLVLHVLAGMALVVAALPAWLTALVSAGLVFSAWGRWRKPLAVRGLQWGRDGLWQLELFDEMWRNAHLNAATSRSWPWWVYLDFRLEDGRRVGLVLAADALSEALFRQLRARLKIESALLNQ